MKIQLVSDTHQVDAAKHPIFSPEDVCSDTDVLVLAGDISGPPAIFYSWLSGFDKSLPIVLVMGNHEFYGKDFWLCERQLREALEPLKNVKLLEKESVVIQKTRFLGTTLWSDIRPSEYIHIMRQVNDYRFIDNGLRTLRPEDTIEEHYANRRWLKERLAETRKSKAVVVTHHLPSYNLVAAQYKNSPIGSAFASNLDELILNYEPALWCFGHSHNPTDQMIGNTRCVSNPLGNRGEHCRENWRSFQVEIS